MANTVNQFNMEVVDLADGKVSQDSYKGDGSTTFAKGDLVRITTSGTIVDADTTDATPGSVHGMVLNDWTTAPTTSQFVPIMEFGPNTVLKTQIYAATGSDAAQEDVSIGSTYTIANPSAGIWNMTTTTTNGVATVVGKKCDTRWFESGASDVWGEVYIKFGTPATGVPISSSRSAA